VIHHTSTPKAISLLGHWYISHLFPYFIYTAHCFVGFDLEVFPLENVALATSLFCCCLYGDWSPYSSASYVMYSFFFFQASCIDICMYVCVLIFGTGVWPVYSIFCDDNKGLR
jgi:hypothetical protein